MLLSLAAGNRHPLIPHLELEYPDHDIHEDLYKLIKYSCEKVCPSEQLDMILKIWTTFFSMLCVLPRPQISEGVEDVAMILSKHDKTANYGATGSADSPTEIGSLIGPKEHLVVDMNKNSGDGNADKGFEMKTRNDPQDGDYSRKLLVSSIYAPEVLVAKFKLEREGVELCPTDILRGCGQNSKWSAVKSKEVCGGRQHCIDKGVVDTYGVQAEEYAQKILEESEIAFKIGLVSGIEKVDKEVRLPLALNDVGSQDIGSDRELERMNNAQGGEGIIVLPPCSKHHLQTAKPVTKWIPESNDKQHESQIFYGNDSFYVLIRLHHILYERILNAKLYSSVAESKRPFGVDDSSTTPYARFMNTLYNLLEGSLDNAKYEDDCRANFGARSYPLFMLDKLILKIIKQLQNIATDEMCNKLLQLREYETSRKLGRFNDQCYGDNAHVILQDENTYRIECTHNTPTRLTIQVMDYWFDEEDATVVSMDPKTEAYMEEFLAEAPESGATPGIFLRRNKRKYAHLDETSAFVEAYEGLLVSNGLAKKISGRSSRGLSVLGSEDFMMRRKRRKSLHQNGSSNGNGHAVSSNGWLESLHQNGSSNGNGHAGSSNGWLVLP